MENSSLSFLTLLDTSKKVARAYNIRGIPTTFFIDKDGVIQYFKIGSFSSDADLETLLSKIIRMPEE